MVNSLLMLILVMGIICAVFMVMTSNQKLHIERLWLLYLFIIICTIIRNT